MLGYYRNAKRAAAHQPQAHKAVTAPVLHNPVKPKQQETQVRGNDGRAWYLAANVYDDELREHGSRKCAQVNERSVTLYNVANDITCLDSTCFHAGGNLPAGDIEEIGGRFAIRCPAHGYRVDVRTGAGWNGSRRDENNRPHFEEGKQRRHEVRIIHGNPKYRDGSVYVHLNEGGPPCPSDKYNSETAAKAAGLSAHARKRNHRQRLIIEASMRQRKQMTTEPEAKMETTPQKQGATEMGALKSARRRRSSSIRKSVDLSQAKMTNFFSRKPQSSQRTELEQDLSRMDMMDMM